MRFHLIAAALVTIMLLGAGPAPRASAAPPHTVDVNFVRADVVYVLKIIAKAMDMNVVTDNTVKGSVTMTLHHVRADAALKLVLATNNLNAKILGNTIVVGSEETLGRIPGDLFGH